MAHGCYRRGCGLGMSSASALHESGVSERRVLVVKLGGAALSAEAVLARIAMEITALCESGARPVVVHGGGPQIAEQLVREGVKPRMDNGLRVTDERTLAVVLQVLCGTVNKRVVATLARAGCSAVGLSGIDGGLIRASPRGGGYGLVGMIERVDGRVLTALCAAGFVPVVAPLALSGEGGVLNVNADEAAAAVAGALGAGALLMLTDTRGVLNGSGGLIGELSPEEADRLIGNGTVSDGMIPKVRCALAALAAGVGVCRILDGTADRALRCALAGSRNAGTAIVSAGEMQHER